MAKQRLHLNLSDDAYVRLSQAAHQEGLPVAEVVRRALNIEDYLRSEQDKGAKVIIEGSDGTKRQLVIV